MSTFEATAPKLMPDPSGTAIGSIVMGLMAMFSMK